MPGDVSPGGLQAQLVEFLLQARRVVFVFVVTCEFDALETHLRNLLQRCVEILCAVISDRVELHADRNLLLLGTQRHCPPQHSRHRPFDHLAPGHSLIRHAQPSLLSSIYYERANKASRILRCGDARSAAARLPLPGPKFGERLSIDREPFADMCGRAIKPVRRTIGTIELSKDNFFRSVTCDGPDEAVATGRSDGSRARRSKLRQTKAVASYRTPRAPPLLSQCLRGIQR